ncbi:MAG: hypothetical protein AAF798_10500 [Bacteroidota bacterium]
MTIVPKFFHAILSVVLVFTLSIGWGQASTSTTETYAIPTSKKVTFNLKFAKLIQVKQSTGNTIELKTTIRYSHPELKAIHNIEVNKALGELEVTADHNLDNWPKKKKYNCWNCDKQRLASGECFCLEMDYELLIPEGIDLTVTTINGDIETKSMKGDLELDSINGFIDFTASAKTGADLTFKSINGEIYTDFELDLTQNSTKYSKRVSTQINGGGRDISLRTINGNIFFRKKSVNR